MIYCLVVPSWSPRGRVCLDRLLEVVWSKTIDWALTRQIQHIYLVNCITCLCNKLCISMIQRRRRPSKWPQEGSVGSSDYNHVSNLHPNNAKETSTKQVVSRGCWKGMRSGSGGGCWRPSSHNGHMDTSTIIVTSHWFSFIPLQPLSLRWFAWSTSPLYRWDTGIDSMHILYTSSPWSHLCRQLTQSPPWFQSFPSLIQWRWFPWSTSSGIIIVMCHTNQHYCWSLIVLQLISLTNCWTSYKGWARKTTEIQKIVTLWVNLSPLKFLTCIRCATTGWPGTHAHASFFSAAG